MLLNTTFSFQHYFSITNFYLHRIQFITHVCKIFVLRNRYMKDNAKLKVLAVDDAKLRLTLIYKLIAMDEVFEQKFDCTFCDDGIEAVEVLNTERFTYSRYYDAENQRL